LTGNPKIGIDGGLGSAIALASSGIKFTIHWFMVKNYTKYNKIISFLALLFSIILFPLFDIIFFRTSLTFISFVLFLSSIVSFGGIIYLLILKIVSGLCKYTNLFISFFIIFYSTYYYNLPTADNPIFSVTYIAVILLIINCVPPEVLFKKRDDSQLK
jgi:hypothetical protein